ncbi:MAG: hypothetical protein ACRC2B_14915 [Rubrivivax sp.]
MRRVQILSAVAAATVLLAACATSPSSGPMSFFVTSAGSGDGANLGGLQGADAICQKLATAAGAGNKTWRAYLSVQGVFPRPNIQAVPSINARDRIGQGPWHNAKGQLIATDLNHLHNGNNLNKQTALDERGNLVNGRTETPNQHDILTGSRADGTSLAPGPDATCKGWTSNGEGAAIVGHHDRVSAMPEPWGMSWNFSHFSAGCSQQQLISTGGSGRFYCFASN